MAKRKPAEANETKKSVRPEAKPKKASAKADMVYSLKITLKNVKPPIWRRVHLEDVPLNELHDIIQIVMGWTDSHLHAFDVAGIQYGDPDPEFEQRDERKLKLGQIVKNGIKKIGYWYDFGDDWHHDVTIEKPVPKKEDVEYPCCVAGARACPPEDCGGPWGYGDFLEAIGNPKHPEHEEILEWVGGAFDPEALDLEEVNLDLRGE